MRWRCRPGYPKASRRTGGRGHRWTDNSRGALFRPIVPHQHSRVTYVELFFDLVFVFAVTQLSHTLLAHFTPLGVAAGHAAVARGVVGVGLHLLGHQLARSRKDAGAAAAVRADAGGLVMSASIPTGVRSAGLVFALAYAAMQVGDGVPVAVDAARATAARITPSASWPGCRVGGVLDRRRLAEGAARLVLWAIALAIEYVSPAVRFWMPGSARRQTADWNVEGGHMAERCALFIIIALGESILVTGATFAELTWTTDAVVRIRRRPSSAASRCGGSISTSARSRHRQISSRRSGAAGAAGLHLYPSADRGRHHRLRGRRRTGAPPPRRPLRPQDGAKRDRRAAAVSVRHRPVQDSFRGFLQLSHGAGIVALCVLAWFAGGCRRWCCRLDHRDHDRGRGVEIDLAEIRIAGLIRPHAPELHRSRRVVLIYDVSKNEIDSCTTSAPSLAFSSKRAVSAA